MSNSDNNEMQKDDPFLHQQAERLRALHEAAGVPQPDAISHRAPEVYVGAGKARPTANQLTQQISDVLRTRGLYRRGKDIGTIDEETGEWESMNALTFCTWVPKTAGIFLSAGTVENKRTGKTESIEGELTVEQARIILASHELRAKLPVIEHVVPVKMPVFRRILDERGCEKRKGFQKLELLQPGYDPEFKVFTLRSAQEIDFDEDLDPKEAAQWLYKILRTFPWPDMDAQGKSNRMAVHLAAMLSVFGAFLYQGKAPFFLYTANLPGSGKSVLAKLCLWAVYGHIGGQTYEPSEKGELRKLLDTLARSHTPYLWFDEMPEGHRLYNSMLNQWATQSVWEGRPMGQNKEGFKESLKCVTFFTGNRITLEKNLGRRTLVVDLFPHQEAKERVLPEGTIEIDDDFFLDEEMRSKILSCLWAFIRHWDTSNRPKLKEKPLPSFEVWSRGIVPIVMNTGIGNPLAPFEAPGSGDDESREMKKLAKVVVDQYCYAKKGDTIVALEQAEVAMKDIVRCARQHGLFTEILMSVDDLVDELDNKRGHKWKLVDGIVEQSEMDEVFGGEPSNEVGKVEPNAEQKRQQAMDYLDQTLGSKWGKFFKRQAVDSLYFPSSHGHYYQFGERGSTKTSKFMLKKVG